MEIDFVPLGDDHIDAVLEIEKKSFPQPWTRGMFEREISLPISNFFVAVSGTEVIGYGGYWGIVDEAHLVNIAVHPKYRTKGAGRRILGFLTEKMTSQNLKKILLEVRKSNATAIQLYEKSGFKVTGIREKYYGNVDDAVLMEKNIGPNEQ